MEEKRVSKIYDVLRKRTYRTGRRPAQPQSLRFAAGGGGPGFGP